MQSREAPAHLKSNAARRIKVDAFVKKPASGMCSASIEKESDDESQGKTHNGDNFIIRG